MEESQGDFIKNRGGTVTDKESELMWTDLDNGRDITWERANAYCENLSLAGHDDWRLPTMDELKGLYGAKVATCHGEGEGSIKLTSNYLWSSDLKSTSSAWYFSISVGEGGSYALRHLFAGRALPVRSLK